MHFPFYKHYMFNNDVSACPYCFITALSRNLIFLKRSEDNFTREAIGVHEFSDVVDFPQLPLVLLQ